MKVAIVSPKKTKDLKEMLETKGFEIDKNDPEVVISYGGDGTILYAEREYQGIPILPIKTTRVCRKCDHDKKDLETVLRKLKGGNFDIKEEMKIDADFKGKFVTALNEIQIRNKDPTRAVRFNIKIGNDTFEDLIGDGIIVATPFGSTGYYKSAGGKYFEKGIGIVSNNLYKGDFRNKIIKDEKIKIEITRDEAYMACDNSEKLVELKKGDEIKIRKSEEKGRFVVI